MIFLTFLDDYQPVDNGNLFTQRLNERRRMSPDDLSVQSVKRFRQTYDMLEKQLKQTDSFMSKWMKHMFH
jgi:hypothetical protein